MRWSGKNKKIFCFPDRLLLNPETKKYWFSESFWILQKITGEYFKKYLQILWIPHKATVASIATMVKLPVSWGLSILLGVSYTVHRPFLQAVFLQVLWSCTWCFLPLTHAFFISCFSSSSPSCSINEALCQVSILFLCMLSPSYFSYTPRASNITNKLKKC